MDNQANENFSLIIPTFREAKNIPELVKRVGALSLGNRQFEMLIMDDDSQDGTEDVVKQLQGDYPWLRLVIRKGHKSLSQSVIDGFKLAAHPLLITMDADLSHPPEKIPTMLDVFKEEAVDFVIGSRYVKEGHIDEVWPWHRKIVSYSAAMMARLLISSSVKDPLSGFLALRKTTCFSGALLEPIGWKIGLELMVKCHCKNIREIPIDFSERLHGTSKLNFKISLNYLQHLKRLFFYKIKYKLRK